ncbi:hypothetical protein I5W36_23315 [Stenotrophomonas maltophilia]|uniref:hypothetical protein n=1 Tax=Stenotrophomonas sp. 232 TaxID=2785387 RepID=UPI0011D1E782|nr:hypothetical protein [Stenotrophomonas sp. 232]MBF9138728.1 hypothetical protein [Stenotrophomonas sp. 232]MBH1779523.1 hypothetical protein [Stenotrophomonas maltophilia]
MTTDRWKTAERNLADDERELAYKNLDEAGMLNKVAAGVLKKVRGQGLESLTPKQLGVYERHIRPSLVEKCGGPCDTLVPAGVSLCENCKIKY